MCKPAKPSLRWPSFVCWWRACVQRGDPLPTLLCSLRVAYGIDRSEDLGHVTCIGWRRQASSLQDGCPAPFSEPSDQHAETGSNAAGEANQQGTARHQDAQNLHPEGGSEVQVAAGRRLGLRTCWGDDQKLDEEDQRKEKGNATAHTKQCNRTHKAMPPHTASASPPRNARIAFGLARAPMSRPLTRGTSAGDPTTTT